MTEQEKTEMSPFEEWLEEGWRNPPEEETDFSNLSMFDRSSADRMLKIMMEGPSAVKFWERPNENEQEKE